MESRYSKKCRYRSTALTKVSSEFIDIFWYRSNNWLVSVRVYTYHTINLTTNHVATTNHCKAAFERKREARSCNCRMVFLLDNPIIDNPINPCQAAHHSSLCRACHPEIALDRSFPRWNAEALLVILSTYLKSPLVSGEINKWYKSAELLLCVPECTFMSGISLTQLCVRWSL